MYPYRIFIRVGARLFLRENGNSSILFPNRINSYWYPTLKRSIPWVYLFFYKGNLVSLRVRDTLRTEWYPTRKTSYLLVVFEGIPLFFYKGSIP